MIRDFFRNPLSLSLLAATLGIVLAFVAETTWIGHYPALVGSVAKNIAGALVTAGIFGALFEHFGRQSLIAKAVAKAVGQSKTTLSGVSDFEPSADRVAYADDIKTSTKLVVSSRFSTSFIARHKGELAKRLSSGKKMTLLRAPKSPNLLQMHGYRPHEAIEDYVRRVYSKNVKCFTVKETVDILSYNFVVVDRGVWVKLYWNSEKHDFPPAFFVEAGSNLHREFMSDIERVVKNSVLVPL